MNGVIAFPASFWCHPRFDDWRGKARKESRFLRVLRVLQGNGDLYAVQMTLRQWKASLTGALQSVLAFLQEGQEAGIWDWDESEGRLELAEWVWEEFAAPQTALPLFEEVRPPSKQPDAVREEKRRNRARQQAQSPSATPADPLVSGPADPVIAAAAASHVGSELEQFASDIEPMSEAMSEMSEHVGRNDLALASLAKASLCIHNTAKARALSLAARVTPSKQYPNNSVCPSETVINALLQIGYAPQAVEDAIAAAQTTPNVLQNGGIGDWHKYLQRKLATPDAAKTGRMDMLVPSAQAADVAPAASRAVQPAVPPAPLQHVAYDSAGRAVPISAGAAHALREGRERRANGTPPPDGLTRALDTGADSSDASVPHLRKGAA